MEQTYSVINAKTKWNEQNKEKKRSKNVVLKEYTNLCQNDFYIQIL